MFGLNITGFFTSMQFVTQLAAFITALFSALAGEIVAGLFGVAG